MGISRSATSSSSLVLCLVVDTTASMANAIAELKTLAASVVSNQTNTPSVYILIPFNETSEILTHYQTLPAMLDMPPPSPHVTFAIYQIL